MIKAIALDDEPLALRVLENYCGKTDFIDLQKSFSKATEARKWLEKNPVDLLLLDINMPYISGIDFYRAVQQPPMVIFTTAYSNYAVEGFNLKAIDYLLKPFTCERFLQAAEKAKEYYGFLHPAPAAAKPEWLLIKADYSVIKIPLADILFIEGLDDYLKIHVKDQKPVIARMTMKVVLEKLPPDLFTRVHRSYIVSLKAVGSVRNKIISIGAEEIPVSSSYEEAFARLFGL